MVSLAQLLDAQAVVESSNNPRAVSRAGAQGLHQFMPATWKQYGRGKSPFDPVASRDAAGRYLADLYAKYGDARLALAAYNGGSGAADFFKRHPQYLEHPDYKAPANTWRHQTADYVKKITSMINPISSAHADETPYQEPVQDYDNYQQEDAQNSYNADEWEDITPVVTQSQPVQKNAQTLPAQNDDEWEDITDQVKQTKPRSVQPQQPTSTQAPEDALHALNAQGTQRAEKPKESSFIDKAIGTGEAAIATATGLTGGLVGAVGGTVKSLADHLLAIGNIDKPQYQAILNDPDYAAKMVHEYSGALTYHPRTEEGKKQAGAVGDFATNVLAGLPITGELQVIGEAARPSLVQASEIAKPMVQPVVNAAKATAEIPAKAVNTVKNASLADLINANPEKIAKANELQAAKLQAENPNSLSAAGVDEALKRQALAESFPVPFVGERGLTEGMLRRVPSQQAFESDIAKMPEGEGLVKRMTNIEKGVYDNLDEFFNMTGAEARDLHQAGATVVSALDDMAGKAKKAVNAEYAKAAASPEGMTPVKLDNLVSYLNENAAYDDVAKILPSVRKHLVKNGFATVAEDGSLIATEKALKDTEILRQSINANTAYDPANQFHARNMKGLIDQVVDESGGDLYQKARQMHRGYAETFKNTPIIAKLLKTKNGTNERAVALEDVYNHAVLNSQTDGLAYLKKVLTGEGEQGRRAWNELQGRVIANIIDDANRLTAPNAAGEAQVSVAGINKLINRLDKESKLDILFEPKQAEMLRELADITKTMLTQPNGVVNHSNTGRVVMQGLATGIPVPLMSLAKMAKQGIKTAQTKAKVEAALKPSLSNRGEIPSYQPMDLPDANFEPFDPVNQYVTPAKPRLNDKPSLADLKLLNAPNRGGDIIKFSDGSEMTRADRVRDLFAQGKTQEEAIAQAEAEFSASNRVKKPAREQPKRGTISDLPKYENPEIAQAKVKALQAKPVVFDEKGQTFGSSREAEAYAKKNGLSETHEPRKFYDFSWGLARKDFKGAFNAATEQKYFRGEFDEPSLTNARTKPPEKPSLANRLKPKPDDYDDSIPF